MNSDWYNSVRTLERTGTMSDFAMRTMLAINVRRTQLRFRRNLKKMIVPTGPFINPSGYKSSKYGMRDFTVVPVELRPDEHADDCRCVRMRDDV